MLPDDFRQQLEKMMEEIDLTKPRSTIFDVFGFNKKIRELKEQEKKLIQSLLEILDAS